MLRIGARQIGPTCSPVLESTERAATCLIRFRSCKLANRCGYRVGGCSSNAGSIGCGQFRGASPSQRRTSAITLAEALAQFPPRNRQRRKSRLAKSWGLTGAAGFVDTRGVPISCSRLAIVKLPTSTASIIPRVHIVVEFGNYGRAVSTNSREIACGHMSVVWLFNY
jgi:hypothetical protein